VNRRWSNIKRSSVSFTSHDVHLNSKTAAYLVKGRKVDGRQVVACVLWQSHEDERAGDGHDHQLLVHPLNVPHVLTPRPSHTKVRHVQFPVIAAHDVHC
jgi:hypothetical protein